MMYVGQAPSLKRKTPPASFILGHLPYEGEASLLRLPFVGELSPQGD